jgi:hypothetical protein
MIEWPQQRTKAAELRARLLSACERLHVPVLFKPQLRRNAAGLAYKDRIEVCDSLEIIESAGTLAHELGHECLHFDVNGDCGFPQEFEEHEACEVEARVLAHFGVKALQSDARASARVQAAVDRIVSEVEREEQIEVVNALQNFSRALENYL